MSDGDKGVTKYIVNDSESQWLYVLANNLLYLQSIVDSSETLGKEELRILTGYICELSTNVDALVDKYIKTNVRNVDHDSVLRNLEPSMVLTFYVKLRKLERFLMSIRRLTNKELDAFQRVYNVSQRALRLVDNNVTNERCKRLYTFVDIFMQVFIDYKLYVNDSGLVATMNTFTESLVEDIIKLIKEREDDVI